ncbi:MAG: hypothetical protein K9L70_11245 [Thiohalocapsa sp.]|nr:hypothetical protein [Thiohalocapsa sp.]
MDYATFKALQALLFFGSALAFCVWQLRAVRRMQRDRVRIPARERAWAGGRRLR